MTSGHLSVCLAAKAARAKGEAPSRSGNRLGETTSISVSAKAQTAIL